MTMKHWFKLLNGMEASLRNLEQEEFEAVVATKEERYHKRGLLQKKYLIRTPQSSYHAVQVMVGNENATFVFSGALTRKNAKVLRNCFRIHPIKEWMSVAVFILYNGHGYFADKLLTTIFTRAILSNVSPKISCLLATEGTT